MPANNNDTLKKALLLPLSKVYGSVTAMRNRMFEWGMLKQHSFDVPVIAVGNLAVGGTGKTPHVEYLVAALRDKYNIAVLSRGYRRSTKGFVQATPHSTPRDIGDEAYQVYHKFGRKIMVVVCEDRVEAIKRIKDINPDINLVILDDGFQHRYVKPLLSIVLTDYSCPYYEDKMLPYGRLRESPKAISRADVVVVTKCPEGARPIDFRMVTKKLGLIPEQRLFFSRIGYDNLRPIFSSSVRKTPTLDTLDEDDAILVVAGIGNPRPFVKYIKSFKPRVKVNIFSDHHEFSRRDLELIKNRFDSLNGRRRIIVTTEKDAVRLLNNPYFPPELRQHIFYQPICVEFMRTDSLTLAETIAKLIAVRQSLM